MEYRKLGKSGIKVSALSLGSWVTYGAQVDIDAAAATLKKAHELGVNFFDNAESYSGGESELIMGAALRKLALRRGSWLISTKIYWGLHDGPNEKNTLNRKRLLEAIDGSLERLGLRNVDLLFCHRADPETPMEELVWTMHDIVASGKATYWGTSEWTAEEIREAWDIADRRNLRKPVMEQPQYNLFTRNKVEREFARLYDGIGLGLTTWSPLSSGVLSGKYAKGIPEGSRVTLKGYEWLRERVKPEYVEAATRLGAIASEIGATTAQLAIAWAVSNPRVSTVITGASKPEQLVENMKSIDIVPKLDAALRARIEEATASVNDLPPR